MNYALTMYLATVEIVGHEKVSNVDHFMNIQIDTLGRKKKSPMHAGRPIAN